MNIVQICNPSAMKHAMSPCKGEKTITYSMRTMRTLLRFVVAMMLCATATTYGMTLEEILAKALEARGGNEAWAKVQTIRLTATTTIHQAGMEAEMVVTMKRPNQYMSETNVAGTKMLQGYDGQRAWYTNPMTGAAEVMPDAQAAMLRDQADFEGPLVNWAAKGNSVTLVGTVDVDGVKAYKITVKDKTGSTKTLYIDAVTFFEIKMETESDAMGKSVLVEIYRSEYKKVNGVLIPFRVETRMMGMAMSTTEITDAAVNVQVDDAVFAMPK